MTQSKVPKKYKPKNRLPLSKETTFDRVFAFYMEGVKLTAKEDEIRMRWEAAWGLMSNYNSPETAMKLLASTNNISERQARRDIVEAIRLFGDINKTSKDAFRHLLYEYSMKVFTMAMERKDLTEMNRAISNMIKIKGIDREDPERVDWDKLEQHEIKIGVPKQVVVAIRSFISRGSVDMDEVLDIPHEEI